MSKINKVRYLDKKVAKLTIDFSAQRAIDSAYTFDAANIDEAADTITIVGHPYKLGDQVAAVLTAATGVTATVPNATAATVYYVIYVDQNTIALATSLALAKAGTKTALTAGGCVDSYLQRDCFGLMTSDLVIPLGSVVTKVWYDVITTCKSWDEAWGVGNEDAATMSFGINSAVDVKAASAISSGTLFDAGEHATLIGTPILGLEAAHDTALELIELENAKMIKTTADVSFNYTIAVDPISIGKIDVYVEYLPGSLA